MSSEIKLEGTEDIENVPLVRMEDVQPRDRSSDYSQDSDEVLETCLLDDAEYEECVVDDEDSNIGSMVSIQSEEVVCDDDSAELIVPEVLAPVEDATAEEEEEPKIVPTKTNKTDSWPTLEILPGGVINLADKNDVASIYPNVEQDTVTESKDMMYACAKCSQSFKYLFCLVKHVKWHEEEEKKGKAPDLSKLTALEKKMLYLKRARHELDRDHKRQKIEIYHRIAMAIGNIDDIKQFC